MVFIKHVDSLKSPLGAAALNALAVEAGMAKSIKLRTKVVDGRAEIRMLLRHPMDVGRKLKNGEVIPPHFISELTCRYDQQIVMQAHWGAGISKNPYVAFTINSVQKGGQLSVEWLDNQGNTDRLDHTL